MQEKISAQILSMVDNARSQSAREVCRFARVHAKVRKVAVLRA